MNLPRFAIVMRNEFGSWDVMTMEGLMTYEQAKEAMQRHRSKGYSECYMVALAFIVGPQTDFNA